MVFLDGIVYSAKEHHPFTKVARKGKPTALEIQQMKEISVSKHVGIDKCALPKTQSTHAEEAGYSDKATIAHLKQSLQTTMEEKKNAVTAAQSLIYQENIEQAIKDVKKAQQDEEQNVMKEKGIKVLNPSCFGSQKEVDEVDPKDHMCTKAVWNATLPTCCTTECSNSQLQALLIEIDGDINELSSTQVAEQNKINDSSTSADDKKISQDILGDVLVKMKESQNKKELVDGAEKAAKQDKRLRNVAEEGTSIEVTL